MSGEPSTEAPSALCPCCGARRAEGAYCAGCGRRSQPDEGGAEQLEVLAVFHYVAAALHGLVCLFPLLYLVGGVVMAGSAFADGTLGTSESDYPLAGTGALLAFVGITLFLLTFGYALAIAYAGHCLRKQRNYLFVIVVDALLCLNVPLGTILGIATIVVLLRPGMRARFDANS